VCDSFSGNASEDCFRMKNEDYTQMNDGATLLQD